MISSTFLLSLISGAVSGTSTDVFFFPIDTIKTRLQAKGGFFKNGGYHNIYKGIGSTIVASAPGASLFFITYDSLKQIIASALQKYIKTSKKKDQAIETFTHMLSSSIGEVVACTFRVPAEVIKQRTQVNVHKSSFETFTDILREKNGEGLIKNLYRGYSTTIMREIPFTCIQFPLYEFLKKTWRQEDMKHGKGNILLPWKGAVCGSIAGGVAAAITTPLDFIKTRLMLHKESIKMMKLVKMVYKEEGITIFFSGIGPRTVWISAGGAVFLGTYETVKYILSSPSQEEKLL